MIRQENNKQTIEIIDPSLEALKHSSFIPRRTNEILKNYVRAEILICNHVTRWQYWLSKQYNLAEGNAQHGLRDVSYKPEVNNK